MATTNLNLDTVAGTNTQGEFATMHNNNMQKIDTAWGNVKTYSGTSNEITVSNAGAIGLAAFGPSSGKYGPTENVTNATGNSIVIPQIEVDGKGRIKSITLRTLTCHDTTYSAATASANGLMSTGAQTFAGVKTFNNTTECSAIGTAAVILKGGLSVEKTIRANKVYNAVWNDYAECRKANIKTPGYCIAECNDGIMKPSHKRLQAGCRIISDTFGFCMGEGTPVAVAGRVLAYPSARHKKKAWKVGRAVCSGYCGTVDVMSRLECILFPDRIIGYVSEIPTYEVWECGTKDDPKQVFVDGRVWISVR